MIPLGLEMGSANDMTGKDLGDSSDRIGIFDVDWVPTGSGPSIGAGARIVKELEGPAADGHRRKAGVNFADLAKLL